MFRWLRSLISKPGRAGYAVVYVTVPESVSPDLGFRLRDLFNRVDPEGWWFINPGSFLAMFAVAASGRARASMLIAEIENLKSFEPELAHVRFGQVEGKLSSVETRADGKILSLPRGKLLNDAAHAALGQRVEA